MIVDPESPDSPIDFEPCMRDGLTCADFAEPKSHLTASEAARLTLTTKPAELISTQSPEFAQALTDQGGQLKRHALAMTCDLTSEINNENYKSNPQQPDAMQVQFIEDVSADQLFDSWYAAYPPGHPDFLVGEKTDLIREHLQPLLDRSALGTNHRSSIALLENGSATAGIIISLREGEPPYGGPWVSEIWVAPKLQQRGLGHYLLHQAQFALREDGYQSLGLSVSVGNSAQRLYESHGFTVVSESWTILISTN